jgi:sugar/nucleoside kinase (ribokinase family)
VNVLIANRAQAEGLCYKHVLVAGELNVDLILSGCTALPQPGKELLAEDALLTLGSSSAICAMGLARLGNRVAFIGKAGCDEWGDFCIRTMEAAGIDMSHVIRDAALKTGITVSLTTPKDRALLTFPGAISALRAEDIALDRLREFRHLHVSSFFLQTNLRPGLRALFAAAHARGMTTSLDPGHDPQERWDGLRDVIEEVDVFLPNENELLGLTPDLRTLDHPRRATVVKLGSRGAMSICGGRISGTISPRVDPMDTTGAGDSFDAGFLHYWFRKKPLDECLRFAAVCGALSTLGMGGTGAQPTAQQAQEFLTRSMT